MSVAGSSSSCPIPVSFTAILAALLITWALVTTYPRGCTITPEPSAPGRSCTTKSHSQNRGTRTSWVVPIETTAGAARSTASTMGVRRSLRPAWRPSSDRATPAHRQSSAAVATGRVFIRRTSCLLLCRLRTEEHLCGADFVEPDLRGEFADVGSGGQARPHGRRRGGARRRAHAQPLLERLAPGQGHCQSRDHRVA